MLINLNRTKLKYIVVIGAVLFVMGIDLWIVASLLDMPKNHMVIIISKYSFWVGAVILASSIIFHLLAKQI